MLLNHNTIEFVSSHELYQNDWDDIERDIHLENIKQNYELSCENAKRFRDKYLLMDMVQDNNKNRDKILLQYNKHCIQMKMIYNELYMNIINNYMK